MSADVVILAARPADADAWRALRATLWADGVDDHRADVAMALARPDAERLTLLALAGERAVGMAEAAIRHDYVNGCDTSPVAFLEGLYVVPEWRRRGVARRLVEQVAAWGRAASCAEFASDAAIDNEASHLVHRALGFVETERVVFFRRRVAA